MRINPLLLLGCSILTFVTGCGGSASTPPPSGSMSATTQQATPAPHAPVAESMAIPATRPAEVSLRFNASSIDAITAGTKTSTCRKGVREFPGNVAVGTDGKRKVNLVILSTATKKFSELSASDAQSDGSGTVEAMKSAIQKSYPDIADNDVVTVISFHVAR